MRPPRPRSITDRTEVYSAGSYRVGYGRTATLSLKAALERLSFRPYYHAVEFMCHPEHQARWDPDFCGNPQWTEVFAGYRSTVDPPAS